MAPYLRKGHVVTFRRLTDHESVFFEKLRQKISVPPSAASIYIPPSVLCQMLYNRPAGEPQPIPEHSQDNPPDKGIILSSKKMTLTLSSTLCWPNHLSHRRSMFMTTVSFWQDIFTTPSTNVSVILRKFYRSIYRREPASSNDGFSLGARLSFFEDKDLIFYPTNRRILLRRTRFEVQIRCRPSNSTPPFESNWSPPNVEFPSSCLLSAGCESELGAQRLKARQS